MVTQLSDKRQAAQAGGGEEKVAIQHGKGKLTARERIEILLDTGSFEESGLFKEHRCTEFGMEAHRIPGDGVVTGYGTVNGRLMFVYAQDFTVLGGSLSEAHAEKICRTIDQAIAVGAPVIGICDSGGQRIQEGIAALEGYAQIFQRTMLASGVVPQISMVMGPCAGGAAFGAALHDFVFMVRDSSFMYIADPRLVKAVTKEEVSMETLGGAETHARASGVADLAFDNDVEALTMLRRFLGFLPANNREKPPSWPAQDPVDRLDLSLDTLVPDDAKKTYDIKELLLKVVDDGDFFELQPEHARNLVIGFGRMNGAPVGFVANQPLVMNGNLDARASAKAARFVRFCDAFNIPLVTFVDAPGFLPSTAAEYSSVITHGAKMLYAYAECTVPKIAVVTRKAYGCAYDVMCSKHLRVDANFAWPSAEIAVMNPRGAANILFPNDKSDPEKMAAHEADYRARYTHPYVSAARGYVDDIIAPNETRKRLCRALAMLREKKLENPWRKHGNIPL